MADKDIRDVLEDNIIPRKSRIHDCVDTGTLQTLADGVRTVYTNDKLGYEYNNGTGDLWDSVNNKITDTILDAKIDIIVGGTMNAPSANTRLDVELVIDDTPEIPVKKRTLEISRNGVNIDADMAFLVYNGAAAQADGFKIYLTAQGGSIDITNKSILVRA